MSEGDVSLIRDEDVLRRMWQQTEDFSRKKEIRAHMYRLREERLRSLYSPEATAQGKGVEAAQTHVKSLLDQSFQGLKSKEVRDAGSPPKDFTYRGQDLKALSNAGWNVESENHTTDDGHTHVKSVHANIEGRYDVDGGKGQFAAVDHHKQAVTDYHDDNTSMKRNESSSNTAAHEEVFQKTDNGTEFSSSKSSSSTSKFQQVSSTNYEVPYSNDDYMQYQDTNRTEKRRQVAKNNDYEQNLRSDHDSAELMSRKVEYPDDNTKVIIETKRLPDGTTVTSTRREFHAPVRSTRTEQRSQTRNESRSYTTSSQHLSDQQLSKTTRDFDSRSNNIVDSQRHADDCDFKRKQTEPLTKKNDNSQTVHTSEHRHESKHFDSTESSSKITREFIDNSNTLPHKPKNIDDYNATNKNRSGNLTESNDYHSSEDYVNKHFQSELNEKESTEKLNNEHNDITSKVNYSTIQRRNHFETDETDHSMVRISNDFNIQQNVNKSGFAKKDDELIQFDKKEQKREESIEKKINTEQYQTTYQTDFTQKKVSNDWSPTHQAWASTLRADSPSSSRPTTRASSPGSKTYRSSTSSLRSSVSPDKIIRKPPSRGGSPNKIDRSSPSRITTDKYTTTHSTHSVIETKNNRYQSPDRKPSKALSSPACSPERKSPANIRSNQSPEKRIYKPSVSPQRYPGPKSDATEDNAENTYFKPTDKTSHSPERKPQNHNSEEKQSSVSITSYRSSISPEKQSPKNFPAKPSQTPDRAPERKIPIDNNPQLNHPKTQEANRTSISPERKTSYKQPEIVSGRNSVSPDKIPGYMRPTASKSTSDKNTNLDRQSPQQFESSKSPVRQPISKTTKNKEDHYQFIDEKTRMYSHSDHGNVNNIRALSPERPRTKSPTPITTNHGDAQEGSRPDSPSLRSSLRKGSRSPSPPKGPVTFTQDDIDKPKPLNTIGYKLGEQRDVSPTKHSIIGSKNTEKIKETIFPTEDKNVKYDSTIRHKSPIKNISQDVNDTIREPSPKRYGSYDKVQCSEETNKASKTEAEHDSLERQSKTSPRRSTSSVSETPSKKSPKGSTSPAKSIDPKHKNATEFIIIERTTEEVNRKSGTKEHPRQLITPSSSPTRKPKGEETAPSTGQSSPTTSVSGFIYFSSPKIETTTVTDLDGNEFYSEVDIHEDITTTTKRPDTLKIEKRSSPSKIPCRSPSPEKRESPNKDNLPRKSSLKKTSIDTQTSPNEKPPTNFCVSPADEDELYPKHKVVKKERPDIDTNTFTKTKPPLERRETYEERCRKILGMMDDNVTKTVTKETIERKPDSNIHLPQESTCYSPQSKETIPLTYHNVKRIHTTNLTDEFITHEQNDTVKMITSNKSNTPSRESSPSKLQNISQLTKENITSKTVCDSVDKETGYQKQNNLSPGNNNQCSNFNRPLTSSLRRSTSPEKKAPEITPTPAHITRRNLSPERTNVVTTSQPYKTKTMSSPDVTNSERPLPHKSIPTNIPPNHKEQPTVSSDRKPNYMRPTAATITKYESNTAVINEKIHENTNVKTNLDNVGLEKDFPEDSEKAKLQSKDSPRYSVSPERSSGKMRPTTATAIKAECTGNKQIHAETITENKRKESTFKTFDTKHSVSKYPKEEKQLEDYHSLLTPKEVTSDTINVTEFIQSEHEQEILNRVQRSLRKLSPDRNQRSSSREKSPEKINVTLQDIVISNEKLTHEIVSEKDEKSTSKKLDSISKNTTKDSKPTPKPSSRNVSPSKKQKINTLNPESNTRNTKTSRSTSPKKLVSPIERPQSPHVPKGSGIKPREQISSQIKKPSSSVMASTRIDRMIDDKKLISANKPNSFTKTSIKNTSTTSKLPSLIKSESEMKCIPVKSLDKENVSPKKDDTKVTRTISDNSIRYNKTSPQRIKSKPEIQVNDISTNIKHTTTTKIQKSSIKEPKTKLAPKPKSATALNTSVDEDDVIVDVELAKSSRENSPDRICPTPINFLDDVGTPRFPDEVSEPDDEFCRRTHQTIHEAESLVDDIVEICEDDELFVKQTNLEKISQPDEYILSVNDKISKFINKVETISKSKDTAQFKDTEKSVHSDFISNNLKSDECLLSVSEKVNKFAQGPKDADKRSPSRKIVDEYDTETTYQDDYTKLSVNDKAHLFVESAENSKITKTQATPKIERPDLSNVDESLKSDDCLLSVSDKVNKFVKTAEQFLTETPETENNGKKVQEQFEKIIKHITQDQEQDTYETKSKIIKEDIKTRNKNIDDETLTREVLVQPNKYKNNTSSNSKSNEKAPVVKITTLRSSEAVKKAKALFENIASTTQKSKNTKGTKLTDIGVLKKPSHSIMDDTYVIEADIQITDNKVDDPHVIQSRPLDRDSNIKNHFISNSPDLSRKSPMRPPTDSSTTMTKTNRYPGARAESPKYVNSETEIDQSTQKVTKIAGTEEKQTGKDKSQENIPGYQRPTKTSQFKEEKSVTEEVEISTRRGSGKFGVELRKTSVERLSQNNEKRRSSAEHHQPCIEDIFDLDLLEQMLEKVVGYEQRRRIRAQIRVTKKKIESEHTDTSYSRTSKYNTATKNKSPEYKLQAKTSSNQQVKSTLQKSTSPDRKYTPLKTMEHIHPTEQSKLLLNGHTGEPVAAPNKRQRTESPDKSKTVPKITSHHRQPSPDKKNRVSPTKSTTKPKNNKFNEYATAYMKKVGLNDIDKVEQTDVKIKVNEINDHVIEHSKSKSYKRDYEIVNQLEARVETKATTISKKISEKTSSKDKIEIIKVNGKRSPSPDKKRSSERQAESPSGRLYQRTPSPDFKRIRSERNETIIKTVIETEPTINKKETITRTVYESPKEVIKDTTIKTIHDVEKNITSKQPQDEKPSWVTNRNLKKSTLESKTYNKKLESDKTKYRSVSPSKVISKPTDVITSSYGPGPLDANGKPLFGIKALRNGATNYQVKGTVIRQEFHSRNGGEPEGTVSVTAYSTEPEDLEKLLQSQGERPSRLHGLAAITTTKKFGGETGTTLKEVHSKEERASLDEFTHRDRKVIDSRIEDLDSGSYDESTKICENRSLSTSDTRSENKKRTEERREKMERREDKKTVRQSSVKSITEKYIKNANEASRSERSAYPKAGLILRTATLKDSVSSDSSAHAGLHHTDSDHSLGSMEDVQVSSSMEQEGRSSTTVTTRRHHQHRAQERSFLDSTTKVSGVQDILTRMKNADIVIQEGDSSEDTEARALLNKFLGATVLMAGMQGYVTERPGGKINLNQDPPRGVTTTRSTSSRAEHIEIDIDQCWDEALLRKLLEDSSDYEQRRRIRARIRTLMAEQEACASAVTDALAAAGEAPETPEINETREEEEVTVTSSARRDSSEKTVSSSTTTKTSKVVESMARPAPKPVSPFAKFRQLEKQNSSSSPNHISGYK